MKDDLTLFFVAGQVRSGTTVLANQIARRTGGMDAGEVNRLPILIDRASLCSCGLPVTACEIWSLLAATISRSSNRYLMPLSRTDRARIQLAYCLPERLRRQLLMPYQEYARRYSGVLCYLSRFTDGPLVDSSKWPEIPLLLGYFYPRLRILPVGVWRPYRQVSRSVRRRVSSVGTVRRLTSWAVMWVRLWHLWGRFSPRQYWKHGSANQVRYLRALGSTGSYIEHAIGGSDSPLGPRSGTFQSTGYAPEDR